MNSIIVTAASIVSLLSAAPALADPAATARPAAEATAAAPAPGASPARKPTRYCFVDTVTGSHIPVRSCKTREGWQRIGVEIPANL